METKNYWLNLFSGTTWIEFVASGSDVTGFRESRWRTVQKIKIGDYLLCYLTGISRFIAVLEVISNPFKDTSVIWKDNPFPTRLRVKSIVSLTPETALPVFDLKDKLSMFQNLTSTHAWTGHFRGSPSHWKFDDGQVVLDALIKAEQNPKIRDVDPKKFRKKPQGLKSNNIGKVTIPEKVDENVHTLFSISELITPFEEKPNEVRKHTEIEYFLLNLGHGMGFGVWVARNDRNREYNHKKFSEHFPLKDSLPLQFDEATLRTVELIDILWLKGNAIVAAFEVESTTSIYSGLLRMSDLISMQPNINIPLYLVAPDERRRKVFEEVNRPTFMRLSPPLTKLCRYLSFEKLIETMDQIKPILKFLKPEFIVDLSEECKI